MEQKLQQKLFNRFPNIYKVGELPIDYLFFGIECDDGWFNLLWKLSESLEKTQTDVQALQVKEKFGTLRFYINGGDDVCPHLIIDAEERSAFICEICGRKGKLRDYGWLKTLCWYHYLQIMLRRKLERWQI